MSLTDYSNVFTQHVDVDGTEFYNLLHNIHIDVDDSSLYQNFRYDGSTLVDLAYRYYQNSSLWWIIASSNNIANPLELPETGTQLKILNKSFVNSILNSLAK